MSIQEIIRAVRQLPPEQLRQFDAEYERLRHSAGGDGAQPDERSAHEKAKHLIGPGSGIADLTTNPAHMEGYGRDSLS